jgi:hypothetical protein
MGATKKDFMDDRYKQFLDGHDDIDDDYFYNNSNN